MKTSKENRSLVIKIYRLYHADNYSRVVEFYEKYPQILDPNLKWFLNLSEVCTVSYMFLDRDLEAKIIVTRCLNQLKKNKKLDITQLEKFVLFYSFYFEILFRFRSSSILLVKHLFVYCFYYGSLKGVKDEFEIIAKRFQTTLLRINSTIGIIFLLGHIFGKYVFDLSSLYTLLPIAIVLLLDIVLLRKSLFNSSLLRIITVISTLISRYRTILPPLVERSV